jgi:hypothetical protein
MRVTLGDECEDMVSGFRGIATSRTEWLNGCVRIGISPRKLDKDGKLPDAVSFDEEQVKVLKKAAVVPARIEPVQQHGGDRPAASRGQEAPRRR